MGNSDQKKKKKKSSREAREASQDRDTLVQLRSLRCTEPWPCPAQADKESALGAGKAKVLSNRDNREKQRVSPRSLAMRKLHNCSLPAMTPSKMDSVDEILFYSYELFLFYGVLHLYDK